MKVSTRYVGLLSLAVGLSSSGAWASSLDGRWDATLTANGAVIPFRLDISGDGPTLKGTLYNGEEKEYTTKASFEGEKLVLNLEHYLTRIIATEKDGQLVGKIEMRGDKWPEGSPFHAVRYVPKAAAATSVPSIDGQWIVPINSPKGEKAWRFIVKQNGPEVSAAILRVDGDTGALTGTYQDGRFVLSHFDGSRPYRLEVIAAKDGTLQLEQQGGGPRQGKLVAYRPEVAKAQGLPEPPKKVWRK